MKRVLMVAMHFPPMYGSGVQRLVAFQRDLRAFGWHADILTIKECALPDRMPGRESDLAPGTDIVRAFGVDGARHLAFRGRYFLTTALPDRWASWRLGGFISGIRQLSRHRYDALFSSFPIATAHVIAADLHAVRAVPWVADFRDPMAQDEYPADARVHAAYRKIERRVVAHAAALTFTTEGALSYYADRFGDALARKSHLVPNGYDDTALAEAERAACAQNRRASGLPLVALHSGILYPWERDPTAFFEAVADLDAAGFWRRFPVRFHFRGAGFETHYAPTLAALGIAHLVEFLPALPYRAALQEMFEADFLLLFQARNSNFQIPAKAYEYLRTSKPIFAAVDPAGDTARLMLAEARAVTAPIESTHAITTALQGLAETLYTAGVPPCGGHSFEQYSRVRSAALLADILNSVSMRN